MNHFYMLPEHAFRPVGGRMTYEGGKSKAPKAPDYTGAAQAQAESSKEVTNMQNYANRPTQETPWGSTSWTNEAVIDPGTGQQVTKWTQKETLAPEAQKALEGQMAVQSGRSDLAQGFMGRVGEAYKDPFSYEGMPERAQTPGQTTQTTNEPAFAAERQRIENAMFERMAPEHQRSQQQLDQQLANQGITPGSDAYKFSRQELADRQEREKYNALMAGGTEQQRMQQMLLAQQGQAYGQETAGAAFQNQNRQQAIAEEAQRRGMSLNEMNALLTGQQVQTPQMPSFMGAQAAQPLQALQAAQLQGNYDMAAYNADQQGSGALWGGIGSAAGSAAAMY